MSSLLFTLDYELFGNGSGDVFKHIIKPTEKILAIAKQYGTKMTIFFEVIEYWRLKEEWEQGNMMGYKENPISAIENQIREACRQGHDIQLHLHPQWINSRWENGHWEVNLDEWRLGCYKGEGDLSLVNLLRQGKQTLEALLKPINEDYQCFALRAGGYNIQPSQEIVKAMMEVGFIFDSSIYPGGKETGYLSYYDYTSIDPTIGYWQVGEQIEEFGTSGIIELPIVAFPMIRLKKYLTWQRLMAVIGNVQSAHNSFEAKTSTSNKPNGKWDKICYFFQTEWQTWDFCLFSPSLHKEFLKRIAEQKRDVFVLVGPPKSFSGGRGLRYLLKKTQKKLDYKTISEVWDKVKF